MNRIRYTLLADGSSDQLLEATALRGRRLKKKKRELPAKRLRRVNLIRDFSSLESVPAFAAFTADLDRVLRQLHEPPTEP